MLHLHLLFKTFCNMINMYVFTHKVKEGGYLYENGILRRILWQTG